MAQPVWDRHAIAAEVKRSGLTLTGIARDAGLWDAACREALVRSQPSGERALSEALGIPLEELFPDRYASQKSKGDNTHNGRGRKRQKRERASDKIEART
ncbi:helix-turn-helix domain-containing protein [Afifella pfennigii]|uniref:helix-turn-helix domain-containing protein n=1 Tax=Afifella pfennigii TaxID=209897 RepID=UPI00047EAA9C|nr:helix-turn-helix domain-containing protein [Afifella pfennigii]